MRSDLKAVPPYALFTGEFELAFSTFCSDLRSMFLLLQGCEAVASYVAFNTSLLTLNLRGNPIPDGGARALAEVCAFWCFRFSVYRFGVMC